MKGPGRRVRVALLTWLPLSLGSCVGTDTEDVSDDPFDVALWTVEGPLVTIGSVDDSVYAFGVVQGLDVGPDGLVYSRHFGEVPIRRWTRAGDAAGSVGREGEGPGEFISPRAVGFFGDSLWVMDGRAYSVSYFDLDGAFLGSVTPRVDLGSAEDHPVAPPRPERPLRDGTMLGQSPAWSQEMATGELTGTPVVHTDASGVTLARVWMRPHRTTDVLALLNEDRPGGSFGPQPFGDGPLSAMTEHGYLVVDRRAHEGQGPGTLRLTLIGLGGDTLIDHATRYETERLPPSVVDSTADARAAGMHSFMSRRDPGLALGAIQARVREATYAPQFLPPVDQMVIANNGDIWLRRNSLGSGDREWWIFDSGLEPVGRAVTPADLAVRAIVGEDMWGVITDELDVSYIVRYRLRSGPGGV